MQPQAADRRRTARIATVLLATSLVSSLAIDGSLHRTAADFAETVTAFVEPDPPPVTTAPYEPRHAATLLGPGESDLLHQDLAAIASASGARVAIALRELSGRSRGSWSLNGGQVFTAASTYKLPVLMLEAQRIAAGQITAAGQLCFEDEDWEDGYFGDYTTGDCYSRSQLAWRVAHFSDNTAAHMLVRDVGGTDALNGFARAHGATRSAFFVPNTTTADDLAVLWVAEALGDSGDPAAQRWLYPILMRTAYEQGIPSGVPSQAAVVHKIGDFGGTVTDAALITAGTTHYVLVVSVDGLDSARAYRLIAQISARVWIYESSRRLYPPAARPVPAVKRLRTGS